jgi:hypothetical protein
MGRHPEDPVILSQQLPVGSVKDQRRTGFQKSGNPLAVSSYGQVHGVRRQIDLSGPSHHSELNCGTRKRRRVTKRGEDAGASSRNRRLHVDLAPSAIQEADPEPIVRPNLDSSHPPSCLQRHSRGRIPFSGFRSLQSAQSSSNAKQLVAAEHLEKDTVGRADCWHAAARRCLCIHPASAGGETVTAAVSENAGYCGK